MRFQRCAVVFAIVIGALLPARAAAQTIGFVYGLARPNFSPVSNSLYGAAVDATGTLIPLAGFPMLTGGNGDGNGPDTVFYDAAGGRLFALNVASNTVSAWSVNNTTGALTSLPFSPIALPAGFRGGCISVNPSGSVLAVGGASQPFVGDYFVASFSIGASIATQAAGSPVSAGTAGFSCTFSRDGAFFYTVQAGGGGSVFAGLSVNQSTGILTPLAGSPFNAGVDNTAGFQTDSAGRLFVSARAFAFAPPQLLAFTTSAGIPAAVAGNPFANTQLSPAHGLLHPAGYYLTTASMSNDVGVFRISGSGPGTTLSAVAGSPFPAGGQSGGGFSSSVVDSTGRFIVTSHYDTRNLTLFGFNPATGALTQLQVTPVNSQGTSGLINGLAFAPFVSAPLPPTPIPPIPPSFVGGIPDQTVPQNGSVTVPFRITGAVIARALGVSLASSNTTLLQVNPTSLTAACAADGFCTLRITPQDGRAGTSRVTVTLSDGTLTTSLSFLVTVVAVRPSGPAVTLANVLGTGIVLTWTASDTGTPMAYAIAWGTSSGASNLPVQLVPGTSTRFELSALPAGTYFFRVQAVGAGDLSAASPQTSATVTSSAAPGPPLALIAFPGDASINARWTAPLIGAPPSIYEIQAGRTPGAGDLGSATTAALSFGTGVGPGTYWVRTRAASGGAIGAWSSSVQLPVGGGACAGPPGVPVMLPVMLPVTTTSGLVAFTWWPGTGTATSYQVLIAPGLGLASTATFPTGGPGTSFVWPSTGGSFAARVVATNACGSSPQSNQVAFTVVPAS